MQLDGNITYDWIEIAQSDRESMVSEILDELNNANCVPRKLAKKNFKTDFKIFLKDKDYKAHYYQVKNKIHSTKNYDITGFYKGKVLIMYALKYNDDDLHNYYYDVFGNLRFVDVLSSNYPIFPYYSKQFYRDGKTVAYFYYLSDNMQFIFDNNLKFKGVWQNKYMYDLKGNVILTRGEFTFK